MPTWTPAQQELVRRVTEQASADGWSVTPTEAGFEMERDLTEETRATQNSATPEIDLDRSITHEVRFTDDGGYVVTDVDRRTRLDRRGPDRGVSRSVERGRKVGGGFSMTFKWQDGWFRRVDTGPTQKYDLSAGRDLVERIAEEVGLEQPRARLGWEAKVALAFALVGGLGALVAVVVLLVLALTGGLPPD